MDFGCAEVIVLSNHIDVFPCIYPSDDSSGCYSPSSYTGTTEGDTRIDNNNRRMRGGEKASRNMQPVQLNTVQMLFKELGYDKLTGSIEIDILSILRKK